MNSSHLKSVTGKSPGYYDGDHYRMLERPEAPRPLEIVVGSNPDDNPSANFKPFYST